MEGRSYTFAGQGENLSWSYDASSDGKGEIQMGVGATIQYSIPTGVTGARTITVFLKGAGGSDQLTYKIGSSTAIQFPAPVHQGRIDQLGLKNEPNPFFSHTTITYNITSGTQHTISIYTSSGDLVREIRGNSAGTRQHQVVWDGKNAAGQRVKEGVYYYMLNNTGRYPLINRMMLVR